MIHNLNKVNQMVVTNVRDLNEDAHKQNAWWDRMHIVDKQYIIDAL